MDTLERIAALREKCKWSVWKLAEESGVDQSTISAWYNKGRSPSVASLEKICNAFGITMSQFFTDAATAVNITKDQWEILENWSALTDKQKEALLLLIKNIG